MRGGNRPGAGRKPSGKRRIVMYGTLAEEHLLRDFLRKHRRQASTPAAVEEEIFGAAAATQNVSIQSQFEISASQSKRVYEKSVMVS